MNHQTYEQDLVLEQHSSNMDMVNLLKDFFEELHLKASSEELKRHILEQKCTMHFEIQFLQEQCKQSQSASALEIYEEIHGILEKGTQLIKGSEEPLLSDTAIVYMLLLIHYHMLRVSKMLLLYLPLSHNDKSSDLIRQLILQEEALIERVHKFLDSKCCLGYSGNEAFQYIADKVS